MTPMPAPTARSRRAERIVRQKIGDGKKDGGMVGDDEVCARLLRRADGALRKVEGKERAGDLAAFVDEDAAVVMPAVGGDISVAHALGICRVDLTVNFSELHRKPP